MTKSDAKFKEAQRRRRNKILNRVPMSFKSRHIMKGVEPIIINNFGLLFAKHTNNYPNARGVRVNNTGNRAIDFDLRSYFQHIKGKEYKCMICNSKVIKKHDAFVFFNEDNTLHRKKFTKKGYFVCRIMKSVSDKPRVKHIGRFKPQDNTFMVIE